MTQPAPRQGQCPNCGATVEFKLGASLATVCTSCQTIVARKGTDYAAIGKVADLIPTGTRVALGAKGHLDKVAFEVVGRLQYEWKQGVWDEWYVAFADGRWGWLAEAQGRFYLTFKVPPRVVPTTGLKAGATIFLEGLGRFAISDVKNAKIVGIAGELPEPVILGESPLTVDFEGGQSAFGTIDFGVAGSAPAIFLGKQLGFEALNLGGLPGGMPTRGPRPTGQKLACPNCGAPLTIRLPDQSVRVVCESCHDLIDASQGAFQVIEAVGRGKREPRIPLGTRGKLRDRELLLVGFMVRSCVVEGTRYTWDEYLLFDEKTQGFVWLVDSDGHWQFVTPISVAEVHVGRDAEYQGTRYRHFSSVDGTVETVLGEFYWAVSKGDTARLDDYIAPPSGLSCEQGDGEVSWSHCSHLERAELATAFDRPGLLNAQQTGVGALQPWPFAQAWTSLSRWMFLGLGAMLVLLFVFALKPDQVYYQHAFSPSELQQPDPPDVINHDPPPADVRARTFLSPPFELEGDEALELEFRSDANQSWAYAAGAVIETTTNESATFGLESSSYSGVEDGESWSEGSASSSTSFTAPGPGKNVLRADLQWDPRASQPPTMWLILKRDNFSGWQFLLISLGLLWPVLLLFHRASFEKGRWWNSNLDNPYTGGDDE